MWRIWNFRNQSANYQNMGDEALYQSIDFSIKEIEASYLKTHSSGRIGSQLSQAPKQHPPPNSWLLKSDASWNANLGCGGVGWVVHDSEGSLVCGGRKKISKNWAIKTLEAKAMLDGLNQIAETCKRRSIAIEAQSDALDIINILAGKTEDLSEVKSLTDQIKAIASDVQNVGFSHCSRVLNTDAHCVARSAMDLPSVVGDLHGSVSSREEGEVFWAPFLPPWLIPLIKEGRCKTVGYS